MVTYSYTVSKDGPTSSVQEVIKNIKNELSTSPIIERDIEVNIGEGSYAGFTIPNASLIPLLNSPYRLIIKSGGNYFPVIDFNFSPEEQTIGIDIGSSNPNVVIQGLRIQFFAAGIRCGISSHYPTIRNCIILNNRNVGIYVEQSNECQISQNIILNGDYGIVTRLCKDVTIIHNTIFQNGAISSEQGISKSCIWAELENDYGGGINDTGKLHLIGNIAWNITGNCITLFETDVSNSAIVSNFNNFVNSNEDLITLEDKRFYNGSGSQPRRKFSTLSEWKDSTLLDQDSISEDPKFIQPLKIRQNRNGYAIDLTILPLSPVLGIVPSFYDDIASAATWLPGYFDTSQIRNDIIGNERQKSGTAIGANDKKSNSGFYGQDIFSNPLDLGQSKECGVDPLLDVIFKKLDIWYPKLKVGYFYSNERQFYLYADKKCLRLSDIVTTEYNLPEKIALDKEVVIKSKGKIIPKENFDAFNNKIVIYHKGLNVNSIDEEFDIECYVYRWKDNGFLFSKSHYIFKVGEGTLRYLLPKNYVPRGPVVITDDKISLRDKDEIANREFSVSFNKEFGQSEIKFKDDSNLIINGQFDYGVNTVPTFWESKNSIVRDAISKYGPAYGDYTCLVYPEGYIGKTVRVTSENHCLSFYLRGQGKVKVSIEYFTKDFKRLGYVIEKEVEAVADWKRKAIVMGAKRNDEESFIPESSYDLLGIDYIENIEQLGAVTIKITNIDQYNIELDGFLLEKSISPSVYHRRFFFNELTVEYESSSEDSYIVKGMAIAPVRNLVNNGFLQIPELTADLFDPTVKSPVITTLHEYRWVNGRQNVIPWARTRGKDKLRKRVDGLFHKFPLPGEEILAPVLTVGQPKEVRITPSLPVVSSEGRVGISIKVTSDTGISSVYNNIVVSIQDENSSFPGWLFKKKYGLKEQLGQTISSNLDSGGNMSFEYIAPENTFSTYFGRVPKARYTSAGSRLSFIETNYPVNIQNHGNVKITDDNGNLIDTKSDVTKTEILEPVYSKSTSIVQTDYPIQWKTVKVKVNNVLYKEINFNLPGDNEYYVDYESGKIYLKGRLESVTVSYKPIYCFINLSNPYQIVFIHDKLFGDYTGNIRVTYDYIVNLTAFIEKPGYSSFFTRSFDIVVQNNSLTKYIDFNENTLLLG